MALSLNHIRLKKKKGKPESEYENTAYQENESSSSTGQDNYYEDLSSSVDLQNLEKKHKAQPNEYSKWCKENDSTYVNQDAFKDLAKSNDETKLPLPSSPKSTVAYTWKIAAIVCVLLYVVSGIAVIAVTVYFQSKGMFVYHWANLVLAYITVTETKKQKTKTNKKQTKTKNKKKPHNITNKEMSSKVPSTKRKIGKPLQRSSLGTVIHKIADLIILSFPLNYIDNVF